MEEQARTAKDPEEIPQFEVPQEEHRLEAGMLTARELEALSRAKHYSHTEL